MEPYDVSFSDKWLLEMSAEIFEAERSFIFQFESLPVLWDSQHQFYTSKYKRLEALRQLQIIYQRIKPGATVVDVRKKINTLRSNYRRELRKIELSIDSCAVGEKIYKPKQWNFPLLHFLRNFKDHYISSHTAKNENSEDFSQTDAEENSSSNEIDTKNSFIEHEDPPVETVYLPMETVSSSFPTASGNIKNEPSKEHIDILDNCNPALSISQINFRHFRQSQRNCSNLASVWIEKLQRLHPLQRLYAEKAINDILFEAELGTLRKNSVKINEPSTANDEPLISPESSLNLEHAE